VIAVNERQVCRIVSSYARYYNRARTHLALAKDAPEPGASNRKSMGGSSHSLRWADFIIATRGSQLERLNGDR
jgi:hypothetical protein